MGEDGEEEEARAGGEAEGLLDDGADEAEEPAGEAEELEVLPDVVAPLQAGGGDEAGCGGGDEAPLFGLPMWQGIALAQRSLLRYAIGQKSLACLMRGQRWQFVGEWVCRLREEWCAACGPASCRPTDDAGLEDFVDTPDEYSSHSGSAFRDFGAGLSGGTAASEEASKGAALAGSKTRKGKGHAEGFSGTVLATSNVSRRLDFSKDCITKALSVVRSKREGFKKDGFGGSLSPAQCAAAVPTSYLSPPAQTTSEFPNLPRSPKSPPLVGSSSKVFDVYPAPHFVTPNSQPPSSFRVAPNLAKEFPPIILNPNVGGPTCVSPQCVTPLRFSYPKEDSESLADRQVIIPSAPTQLSILKIGEISENSTRFIFEGKVLNKYGTYKLPTLPRVGSTYKVPKYLKCDLADQDGCNTITLSIVDNYISLHESKIVVGSFIQVEGPVVKAKNRNDGGTSCFSLQVDATTSILKAEPFDCDLSFHPEIRIKDFLEHANHSTSQEKRLPLGTLAFVVINFDDGTVSGKSSQDLLTIVDGPSPHDRASLSFVNERRPEFTRMVADFSNGVPVICIARNIGAWTSHSNTLSVLDCTILVPVRSARIREELKTIFSKQIAILGYGKEVYGVLVIVNINTVLLQLVCTECKSNKVRRTVDGGGHCFACNVAARVVETPKLDGRITRPDRSSVTVTLLGDVVDKVLELPESFKDLYTRSVHDAREELACFKKAGTYVLSHVGRIVSYIPDAPMI